MYRYIRMLAYIVMPIGPWTPQARISRLKAERQARSPNVRSRMFWFRLEPWLADRLEAQMRLYAKRPSNAELAHSLIVEGLAFREMHRPASRPKRPKRMLPPAELLARLKL